MKNLVEYSSSSESEDDDEHEEVVRKKIKLDLPMLLDCKDVMNSGTNDQTENHQMRVRSIPHIEGNWASHIRIDCK